MGLETGNMACEQEYDETDDEFKVVARGWWDRGTLLSVSAVLPPAPARDRPLLDRHGTGLVLVTCSVQCLLGCFVDSAIVYFF